MHMTNIYTKGMIADLPVFGEVGCKRRYVSTIDHLQIDQAIICANLAFCYVFYRCFTWGIDVNLGSKHINVHIRQDLNSFYWGWSLIPPLIFRESGIMGNPYCKRWWVGPLPQGTSIWHLQIAEKSTVCCETACCMSWYPPSKPSRFKSRDFQGSRRSYQDFSSFQEFPANLHTLKTSTWHGKNIPHVSIGKLHLQISGCSTESCSFFRWV